MTRDQLLQAFTGVKKFNKFLEKHNGKPPVIAKGEIPFNTDYVYIDRILCVQKDEALVKWMSLPYEACTWELIPNLMENVDNFKSKMELYNYINSREYFKKKYTYLKRPTASTVNLTMPYSYSITISKQITN